MTLFCLLTLYVIHISFAKELPPNIDALTYGYNAIEGNPDSPGSSDPGWKVGYRIWNIQNTSNGRTCGPNNEYLCPNGMNIADQSACNGQDTFSSISGANMYYQRLLTNVAISGGGWGFAFSASTEFQNIIHTTSSYSNVYISSIIECNVYQYSINQYQLPSFDTDFVGAIKQMPSSYSSDSDKSWFYEFLNNNFGTHYPVQMRVGCNAGQISEMSYFQYSKFTSSELNIATSARWSSFGASAGVDTRTESEKKEAADFISNTKNQSQWSYGGGGLITNGNYNDWAKQCQLKPLPINNIRIQPISELVTHANFPTINDIANKQKALQSALDDFCHQYSLKNPNTNVNNCKEWGNDPALPKPSILRGLYQPTFITNAYTNEYNCPSGTKPVNAIAFKNPNGGKQENMLMCLTDEDGHRDPLNYFGGFYNNGKNMATIGNALNDGKYSCPPGFEDYQFVGCNQNWQCINPHFCYNKSVNIDTESIIGGIYSTDGSSNCAKNNPYTKAQSCPPKFNAYPIGKTACGPTTGDFATMYICLNNVYIV